MPARGWTLLELLVTVTVAALAIALALPAFDELLARQRGAAAMNQLVGAVHLARAEAILQRGTVTLCPGADECLGRDDWHLGARVFRDENGNGRQDGADPLIAALPALRAGERIYWRAFRNRGYLQFQPRGYTQWQNGSFLYCAPGGEPRYARMIIVNAQGRVRVARDHDGNGVVENASGRNVDCP